MTDMLKKEIIGKIVANKKYGKGKIVEAENCAENCAENYIVVDFESKKVKFQSNAFVKGFLKFDDVSLQNEVEEEIKKEEIKKEEIKKEENSLENNKNKENNENKENKENRENKNIILLKHHPMNVKFTNSFYTNQTENDLSDYIIIDVTSRVARDKEFMAEHPGFDRDLSPFFIGPVTSSDGTVCNIFEIFWQCSKVYPCHDNNGTPNEDFFRWRNEFFSKEVCSKDLMRHACKSLGYEHKDTRYTAYFDMENNKYVPLNYIEARKKIYFPEYAKLVYNSESYRWLKSLVDSGRKIALVDFDAFNYYEDEAKTRRYESYLNKCKQDNIKPKFNLEYLLGIKTMKDLINSPYLAVGHGCVIKAMLQGDIEVIDGEVIDNSGILSSGKNI